MSIQLKEGELRPDQINEADVTSSAISLIEHLLMNTPKPWRQKSLVDRPICAPLTSVNVRERSD